MATRYEVDVVTRFSDVSATIQHLVGNVQSSIQRLIAESKAGSAPASGRPLARELGQIQVGAERQLQALQQGGALSNQDVARARTEIQQLIRGFSQLNAMLGQSGRRLAREQEGGAQFAGALANVEYGSPAIQRARRAGGVDLTRGEIEQPTKQLSRKDVGKFGSDFFDAPSDTDIRNLRQFLNDSEALDRVLNRIAARTAGKREFGLRVGRAEEQALAGRDTELAGRGDQTQSELRAELTRLTRQRETRETQAAIADREYIAATADLANTRKRLANLEGLATARQRLDTPEGREDIGVEGQRRAAEAAIRDQVRVAQQQAFGQDPGAVGTAAEANRLAEVNRQRVRMAELGLQFDESENVAARRGRIAHAEAAAAREKQATQIALTTQEEKASAGRLRIEERKLQQEINREARQYLQSQPGGGGGTRFQQVQSFISARQGGEVRLPEEFLQLKQFLAARALTTAGFAISGAALYGAVSGIKELVTNAEALQLVLSQVQAQFDAIGQPQAFSKFRDDIFAIARDTGTASKDVAFVAFQLRGAFSGTGDAADDTTRAVNETASAIKLAKITGLELGEVVDSLTASALSFGVGIGTIGDVTLSVQQATGVLAKEQIKALGDIAPVAQEAGLSIQDMDAIIATAQQTSGKSGTAIAEGFGRIIPALQGVSVEVVGLYQSIPALSSKVGEIATAAGTGNTGTILKALIRDYDQLTKSQQNQVITLLGGRREAQVLIPVLQNHEKYVRAVDAAYNSAGKTQDYYDRIQKTLSQSIARAREEFRQLGDALFRAGLGDILTDAAIAGGVLLRVLRLMLDALAAVNEATGGWAGHLAVLLVTMRAMRALMASDLLLKLGQFAGLTGGRFAGTPGLAGAGGLALRGNVYTEATGVQRGINAAQATEINRNLAAYGAAQSGLLTRLRVGLLENLPTLGAIGAIAGGQVVSQHNLGVRTPAGYLGGPTAGNALSGAGAGFLLAGGGPAGVIAGSVIGTGAAYATDRAKQKSDEQKLRESIRKADEATLRAYLKGHKESWSDFFTDVRSFFTGGKNPDQIVREELTKKEAAPAIARLKPLLQPAYKEFTDLGRPELAQLKQAQDDAYRAGKYDLSDLYARVLKGGFDQKDLAELLDKAAHGDQDAAAIIAKILEILQHRPGRTLGQAAAEAARAKNKQTSAQQVESGEAVQTAQEALQLYQSGEKTQTELLASFKATRAKYEAVAAHGPLTGKPAKDWAAVQKLEADFFSDQARQSVDLAQQISESANTSQTPVGDQIGRLTRLLQSGKLTPDDAFKAAQDIAGMSKALLDERLKTAKTIQEKIGILEHGVEFATPEAREQIVRQQITRMSPAWQTFISTSIAAVDGLGATFTEEVIKLVAMGKSGAQAAIEVALKYLAVILAQINEQIGQIEKYGAGGGQGQYLQELYAKRDAALSAIEAAKKDADALNSEAGVPGTIKADPDEARRQRVDLAQSQYAVAQARAQGDPVRSAQLELSLANRTLAIAREGGKEEEINAALVQVINAQHGIRQANIDVQQARLAVLKAQAAGDPVRLAQLEQQEANLALASAEGEAARLQAFAQKLNADRAYQDAIEQVMQARTAVAVALLTYAGLDVAAVQLQAQAAQDALNRALALHRPQIEIDQLSAALIQAKQQARDTTLQEGIGDVDTALQLERITTQQAIAQLEALMRIPGLTKKQIDELLIKIQELRRSVSQDIQFDIPSQIQLPTLYETRRALQSQAQGIGYQDNRNININVVANNALDVQSAMNQISSALSGGSRFGVRPRLY